MADGRLQGTGRDIDEFDLALSFDKATCRWSVEGQASLYSISIERREIIEYVDTHGPCGPKDVAEGLGRSYDAVRQLMPTMSEDGQIVLIARGLYALPEGDHITHFGHLL